MLRLTACCLRGVSKLRHQSEMFGKRCSVPQVSLEFRGYGARLHPCCLQCNASSGQVNYCCVNFFLHLGSQWRASRQADWDAMFMEAQQTLGQLETQIWTYCLNSLQRNDLQLSPHQHRIVSCTSFEQTHSTVRSCQHLQCRAMAPVNRFCGQQVCSWDSLLAAFAYQTDIKTNAGSFKPELCTAPCSRGVEGPGAVADMEALVW